MGAVFLVAGGAVTGSVDLVNAAAVIEGAGPVDFASAKVEALGDLDDDGFDDFIVGSPWTPVVGEGSGTASVIYGPIRGLTSFADHARIDGDAADWLAGSSVGGGADLTGDGFVDLVVGAVGADGDGVTSGAVYVMPGGSP